MDALVTKIKTYRGLAVPAHLDKNFSLISQLAFVPPGLEVDAFEIYMTEKIEQLKRDYLAERTEPIICSSDAHHPHHITKPKMRLWLQNLVIGEVFNAFKGLNECRITVSHTAKGSVGAQKAAVDYSRGWVKPPWEGKNR